MKKLVSQSGLPCSPFMRSYARKWRLNRNIHSIGYIIGALLSLVNIATSFGDYSTSDIIFEPILNDAIIVIRLITGPILTFSIIWMFTARLRNMALQFMQRYLDSDLLLSALFCLEEPEENRRDLLTSIPTLRYWIKDANSTFAGRLRWISNVLSPIFFSKYYLRHEFKYDPLMTVSMKAFKQFEIKNYLLLVSFVPVFILGIILSEMIFGDIWLFILLLYLLIARFIVNELAYRAALIKIFSGYWPWEYK